MAHHSYTRRTFVKAGTLALAAGVALRGSAHARKTKARFSFSTLGCPDWNFRQMTEFAVAHGYSGIEFRGVQREMDLTKAGIFRTPAARMATMERMEALSLYIVGLGASTQLHVKEPGAREKGLDEAKRFIDLAAQVQCPYVRVFPDKLPKDVDKAETLDLIADGLTQLADHTKATGVHVLMETHGDVVYAADIQDVMARVGRPEIGLIWDIFNMWVTTGEDPVEVYQKIGPYVRHVHVKDGKREAGHIHHTLMGDGNAPIAAAVRALKINGYSGFYSFEWEKLWHPELPEPEIALAGFPGYMQKIR